MPGLQSYSVDWTVDIAPEGDVSQDVKEIRHINEYGQPRNVTVVLDTSQRPHALTEQQPITVEFTTKNRTVTFNGFTDQIKDAETKPKVTVEARSEFGALDDIDVVGSYNGADIWGAIKEFIDVGPSKVNGITFDAQAARDEYGEFQSSIDFGNVEIVHRGSFGVSQDTFNQHQTLNTRGKQAELRVDQYINTSSTTYTLDITGEDNNGNNVQASLDLPPANSAQDAFGTENIRLALSGGEQAWVKVQSISTDIPTNFGSDILVLEGSIWNYVRTDYNYTAGADMSLRDVMDWILSHIETIDGRPWEYVVTNGELIFRPDEPDEPSLFTFVEGNNVIRPIATRDVDLVKNYIHVSGIRDINVWVWAWDGSLYMHTTSINPHDFGAYPDDTSDPRTEVVDSTSGINDIDEIGLRAQKIDDPNVTSWGDAKEVAAATIQNTYGTRVNGTAPVAGVVDALPGDNAEVFYPSRGIPQQVEDNVYAIEKVEHIIKPDEAKTNIEFGSARPTMSDVMGDAAASTSTNPQSRVSYGGGGVSFAGGGGGGGFEPTIGTIQEVNDDGTVDIQAEDGQTYENVRIV